MGDHLRFKGGKCFRVAEKARNADEQFAKEDGHFLGCLLQIAGIIGQAVQLVNHHAAFDAAQDGVLLVVGKIMPGVGAQQQKDFLQRLTHLIGRRDDLRHQPGEGMLDVGEQLCGHLFRRQLIIHQAGGQRALRHALIFRGGRRLHHHHAAHLFYRAHAEGAVAPGPGEHDADRRFPLLLRQRTEKVIDGQVDPFGRARFHQVQAAMENRQIHTRRDDVDTVALDDHAVFDVQHVHVSIALDQLTEQAGVAGGQMLHQHKGHAAVAFGRHPPKKCLKRRQAPGGRPDAHNGKICLLPAVRMVERFGWCVLRRRRAAVLRRGTLPGWRVSLSVVS